MPQGYDSNIMNQGMDFNSFASSLSESTIDMLTAAFPDKEIGDIVDSIRSLANEYHIDMLDAISVEVAIHSDNDIGRMADYSLARPSLESYGINLYIERPEIVGDIDSNEIDFEARSDDKQYHLTEIVAHEKPDSVCAQACANIERLADLQEERIEAIKEYEQVVHDPASTQLDIDDAQEKLDDIHTLQRPELDALCDDSIDIVKTYRGLSGEEGFSPDERAIADTGIDMYMGRDVEGHDITVYMDTQEAADDGPFRGVADAYAAVGDADERYRQDPSQENLDLVTQRYQELEAAVINMATTPDEGVDYWDRIDKEPSQDRTVDSSSNNGTSSKADQTDSKASAEAGDSHIGKQEWNISDISKDKAAARIDMPFSAREDAHNVMDYAVSKSIFSHSEDYPVFAGGIELQASITNAVDYLESGASKGLPLSAELKEIINELDALGPRNGDAEHDSKIDALEERQEDCYLRAGAIIAGEHDSPDWRAQADAVLTYHDGEANSEGYEEDPRKWSPTELGEARMEVDSATDSIEGRGGPAAEYSRWMDIRDEAMKEIPDLQAKWEACDPVHDSVDSIREASDNLYEANFEAQNAQRMMDRIAEEVRICKEGVSEYGIVHTPDSADIPEPVDVAHEPETLTVEEIEKEDSEIQADGASVEQGQEKTEYEICKEKFESMKDSYSFRNVFTSYSRLKMDIAAYKEGQPGADGKMVGGGRIFIDFMEFTRGNLIESIFEVVVVSLLDRAYPPKDGVDEEEADTVKEYGANTNDFYIHVDRPDAAISDAAGKYFDNGFIDKKSMDSGDSPINKENPGFGRCYGADMNRPSMVKDIEIEVRSCGSKYNQNITYQGADGKMEAMRIPSIRLVQIPNDGRTYLVDPFGKTLVSNVSADTKDPQTRDSVEKPYFRSLDISATKFGASALESYAGSKGISVEQAKENISNEAMGAYVDQTVGFIDKHEAYLSGKQIPEAVSQLDAVSSRLDYLSKVKEGIKNELESKGTSMSDTERADMKKFEGLVDNNIEKLGRLKSGLTARVEKLVQTVELYRDAKDQIKADSKNVDRKDMSPRFAIAVAVEKHGGGKISNPYYGVSKQDIASIDKLISAVDAKGSAVDGKLEREFSHMDWPKESNTIVDRFGAKVDTRHDIDGGTTTNKVDPVLKEAIKDLVPDADKKYPGLFGKDDVGKFDIDSAKFDVSEIVKDVDMPDSDSFVEKEVPDDKESVDASDSTEDTAADKQESPLDTGDSHDDAPVDTEESGGDDADKTDNEGGQDVDQGVDTEENDDAAQSNEEDVDTQEDDISDVDQDELNEEEDPMKLNKPDDESQNDDVDQAQETDENADDVDSSQEDGDSKEEVESNQNDLDAQVDDSDHGSEVDEETDQDDDVEQSSDDEGQDDVDRAESENNDVDTDSGDIENENESDEIEADTDSVSSDDTDSNDPVDNEEPEVQTTRDEENRESNDTSKDEDDDSDDVEASPKEENNPNTVDASPAEKSEGGKVNYGELVSKIDLEAPPVINTPENSTERMKGVMTSSDVVAAIKEYAAIATQPDNTYSFTTDFLEENKDFLDPATVLDGFATQLEAFVTGGEDLDPSVLNTIADGLVSLKESVMEAFADTIFDKVDSIVAQSVDMGTNTENVTAFMDALENSMQPLADRIEEYGFDKEAFDASTSVADTLEQMSEIGVSDIDIDRLESVIETVGRVVEGYPELVKSVAAAVDNDAMDRVDRNDINDTDRAIAAGEEAEIDVPDMEPVAVEDLTVAERMSSETEQREEEEHSDVEHREDEEEDDEDVSFDSMDNLDDGMLDIISDASDDLDSLFRTMMDIDNYEIDTDFDDIDINEDGDFAEDVADTSDTFEVADNPETADIGTGNSDATAEFDANSEVVVADQSAQGLTLEPNEVLEAAPQMEFEDDIQLSWSGEDMGIVEIPEAEVDIATDIPENVADEMTDTPMEDNMNNMSSDVPDYEPDSADVPTHDEMNLFDNVDEVDHNEFMNEASENAADATEDSSDGFVQETDDGIDMSPDPTDIEDDEEVLEALMGGLQ